VATVGHFEVSHCAVVVRLVMMHGDSQRYREQYREEPHEETTRKNDRMDHVSTLPSTETDVNQRVRRGRAHPSHDVCGRAGYVA
jgi:hypothetical protein